MTTTGTATTQGASVTLVQNSAATANPTPVIIKAGNFKVQGDGFFIATATTQVALSLYIIYLPEGLSPPDATSYQAVISAHPEWVLAWKFISANRIFPAAGASATDQSLTFSMSSRLKRNLNSGDRIVLVGLATAGSGLSSANFSGLCQYWTCAN